VDKFIDRHHSQKICELQSINQSILEGFVARTEQVSAIFRRGAVFQSICYNEVAS